MELNRDFQEFLRSFVAHDVRFMIVGGYALAAHGHPRYTKDLDVWVWAEPSNAERVVAALEEFGFGGLGLTPTDFEDSDLVVQLGREPQRIDILTFATGLVFDEAYEHRMLVDVEGYRCRSYRSRTFGRTNWRPADSKTKPMLQRCHPATNPTVSNAGK